MPINIELPDDLFNKREKENLKSLFQIEEDEEFRDKLEKVAIAALKEYKEMFLGMGLSSRADEIQQHRLFFLIENYFKDRIPSESEVSSMFQLTLPKSKNLIRLVMIRYRYDLEQKIRNTLRQTIQEAKWNKDDKQFHVVIRSGNVLEELNRIIDREAPKYYSVTKVPNTSRSYVISEDSYTVLCKDLDINIEGLENYKKEE